MVHHGEDSGAAKHPVLDAAHIRPVGPGGQHRLDNGLLLRTDVNRLFDAGYVTVNPDGRFLVSPRLKDDFDNGEPSNTSLPSQRRGRQRRKIALPWRNTSMR